MSDRFPFAACICFLIAGIVDYTQTGTSPVDLSALSVLMETETRNTAR